MASPGSDRRPLWLTFLLGATTLLAGNLVAAQDQQKPGLDSLLKDLLRDELEGRAPGNGGRIRDARFAGEKGSTWYIDVSLAGIAFPDRASLSAEVYDLHMQPIGGIEVAHDAIAAGDSSVPLRLTMTTAGSVLTSSLRVSLIDRNSGLAWDRHRLALARELKGSGTSSGAGLAGPETTPGAGGGQATGAKGRGLDVEPSPVGDTPAGVVPAGTAATNTADVREFHRPAVAIQPQVQQPPPQQAPAASRQMSKASARPMMRMTLAAQTVDLYALAPQASWSSSAGPLPWNGSSSDNRGFVRGLGSTLLADGQIHDQVLQTHPSWSPHGRIIGSFALTLPRNAGRFVSMIGFLPNAGGSDGVVAEVTLLAAGEVVTVVSRRVLPGDGVFELSGDIPERLRGQSATLQLSVDAGASSTQDWFTWVGPAIR